MEPGIICFQHCGPKIFCKALPEKCPICCDDLSIANFGLLPFRVPYPFVKASQYSCAVLIKPTNGDFLNEYFNSKDLHIGITTSTGIIIEFDRKGLQKRGLYWDQCLLIGQLPSSWSDHWDDVLVKICKQPCWTSDSYKEESFNCYTFVLAFLRELNCGAMSEAATSRTTFCEKFIVPRTTAAGKYISLYRRLRDNGHFVHWQENKKKQEKLRN
ncbi:MKRN2 opposite strand protein [Arctopsyche grandis]|uniref:MKRN2 opposite strand protein n=1 Tax=Arctopsyche grandis TaxID=121162 RepID=UPI00406D9D68